MNCKNSLVKLLLFSPLVLMVSGCSFLPDRKNNYFIEGSYQGIDEANKIYYLQIKNLNENEFEMYQGKNVVKDLVAKKKGAQQIYFLINFYSINGHEIFSYDFFNLEDSQPKTKQQPITYKDDNDNTITPSSRDSEQPFVALHYIGKDIKINYLCLNKYS